MYNACNSEVIVPPAPPSPRATAECGVHRHKMSLLRSPTGSDKVTVMSGSQPNLSNVHDIPHITHRNKRKLLDDDDWIKCDMADLKKQLADVMEVLVTTRNEQSANINQMCTDVSAIKDKLNDMKNTLDAVVMEQNNLKCRLNDVESTTLCLDKKVTNLEANVLNLKRTTSDNNQNTTEEIITEIRERTIRSKNLIIEGIPELKSKIPSDRLKHDKVKCINVLKEILIDCPEPEKLIRIGKYNPNQHRALKVSLSSEELVRKILSNRNKKSIENIKIYSDQTQQQRSIIKKLKHEIETRTIEGEKDLRIKYVRGIPKIISLEKNDIITPPSVPPL